MRSTEVAEPGGFEMDNQIPRLDYRGRQPAEKLEIQLPLSEQIWLITSTDSSFPFRAIA